MKKNSQKSFLNSLIVHRSSHFANFWRILGNNIEISEHLGHFSTEAQHEVNTAVASWMYFPTVSWGYLASVSVWQSEVITSSVN